MTTPAATIWAGPRGRLRLARLGTRSRPHHPPSPPDRSAPSSLTQCSPTFACPPTGPVMCSFAGSSSWTGPPNPSPSSPRRSAATPLTVNGDLPAPTPTGFPQRNPPGVPATHGGLSCASSSAPTPTAPAPTPSGGRIDQLIDQCRDDPSSPRAASPSSSATTTSSPTRGHGRPSGNDSIPPASSSTSTANHEPTMRDRKRRPAGSDRRPKRDGIRPRSPFEDPAVLARAAALLWKGRARRLAHTRRTGKDYGRRTRQAP